ncbi:MAG: EamA family transporter [Polyangiaceae bacterium]|jgi:transporter family protein
MKPQGTWQLFTLGSALFAGLTTVLGKVGVSGINSNLATLLRTVVILAFICGIVASRGEWQPPQSLPRRSLVFLVLSGISTGASWLCYYRALQLGPASRVAPLDKLSVVIAVVLALAFLRETLTLKAALGSAFIAFGAVLLSLP